MDTNTTKKIQALLLEQRNEIEAEMLSHGGVLESGESGELRDPEERASALGELMVDDRIARRDGNLLEKIDFALKRLEEGTYEHCVNCGGVIPLARLLAKPSASLCVTCQAAKEPR